MKDKAENDVVYVKPSKPIAEMSAAEIDEFVDGFFHKILGSDTPKKVDEK